MEWLVDRFFKTRNGWIDAASGAMVRILTEAQTVSDALDWEEQCARLAKVRHPLLNPLLDYGPASSDSRFEAYAALPVLPIGARLDRVRAHAARFLRTAGVALEGARATIATRDVRSAYGPSFRPLGVTLQPRVALTAVQEVLVSDAPASTVATVVGASATGLRTLRGFVARSARLAGFVPICPTVLVNCVPDAAAGQRHFCVLDDESGGVREFAGALVKVASASARRHVIVRFRRLRTGRGAINLDPLSVRSLMGMVFAEPGIGPTEQELFDAARLAEGRPGAFLAQLMAAGRETNPAFSVHETAPAYAVPIRHSAPSSRTLPKGRTLATALRAKDRAALLASRGRHAAAERLLLRASRVLEGRERSEEAACCLLHAGDLALHRGRTADAVKRFERARTLSSSGPSSLAAAERLGEAWIDDLKLVEAEAVLRGALAAADAVEDRQARVAAAASLMRCLNAQDRPADAIAIASGIDWQENDRRAVDLLASLARSHVMLGRTATAVRLARRAEALASGTPDGTTRVTAGLVLAEVLTSAGDTTGMLESLRTVHEQARGAHRPMAAVAARLLECEHAPRDRSLRRLRALRRLRLPRIYQTRVAAAIAGLEKKSWTSDRREDRVEEIRMGSAVVLEALLQACHQAADDRAAVAAICSAALQRLGAATVMVVARDDRRVLVTEGRGWPSSTSLIAQTLASGQPSVSAAGVEPREAAEPVRHGNELVAVVACRWSAGTAADPETAAGVLRAVALAAAIPVRAMIDATPAAPPPGAWGDLLGSSGAATALRDSVTRAARAPFPVLIEGESGCGKELVARAIHRLSLRRDRRFCAVNCAALTDELVEAELFGHARGAFTGAATERAGLFEEADGGTLFLDEVAELSARAQAKLLRVLQEGEVRRVGENFPRRVDVRIVAATNRHLKEEVSAGRFRADLRFRLDVVRIAVPALRDRPGDVPILAAHFWSDASQRVGCRATLAGETLAALARYDWPGNVRELQNVIAWMAVNSPRRGRIGPSTLPAHVAQCAAPAAATFAAAREEFERRFVRAALASADGQMARAARALGVSRQGLSKMMRRLRIELDGPCRLE